MSDQIKDLSEMSTEEIEKYLNEKKGTDTSAAEESATDTNIAQFKQKQSESDTSNLDAELDSMVDGNSDLPVTTLEDLKGYAKGKKVRFPDFAEDQPFVAFVKRPSMLALAKQGKIPNTLLNTAGEMFTGEKSSSKGNNENMLKDMYNVARVLAEASLVSPTLKTFEEAGLELADDQLMAIFNYAQQGTKALESFR